MVAVVALTLAACGKGRDASATTEKQAPDAAARSVQLSSVQKQFLTIETVGASGAVDVLVLPIALVVVGERWPVPSVSAGRSWTSDPYGAANFVGLSVEIPILDTRRGPLAKAESDAIAATLRRELAQAEVAATLERLAGVIAARQAAVERFEDEGAARLPALKQMAEDAYRLGRSSILELLDSTRSRYDLLQTRIDLVAALLEAQVRFLATSGDLDKVVGLGAPEPAPR